MEKIYLMRHGTAEAAFGTRSDSDRRLSDSGRKDIRALGACMRRSGLHPEIIIASPYRRALETALIITESIGHPQSPRKDSRFTPEGDVESITDLLAEHRNMRSLMLVSHNPLVSIAVNVLCSQGSLRLLMPPGSVCCIEIVRKQPVLGKLNWFLTPELLNAGDGP